jgi:hypothetical protein
VLASGVPAPHRITDVAPALLTHFGRAPITEDHVV